MQEDHIVEEVRQLRDDYAKSCGYDATAILEDIRSRQREPGKHIVTRPRRPSEPQEAAT
jgi:hypothetical protein